MTLKRGEDYLILVMCDNGKVITTEAIDTPSSFGLFVLDDRTSAILRGPG